MKNFFICSVLLTFGTWSFAQQKLIKSFFDLSTLNDTSKIYKYMYKPNSRTGYAIHKNNFVVISNTVFTSDDYSILIQGYLLKSKFKLNLKKVNDDGEFIDASESEMNDYFYQSIIDQIEVYLKDSALRKKIKEEINNGLLKYNAKRNVYEYQTSFEKYDEVSILIQNTDTFTITTRILIRGIK